MGRLLTSRFFPAIAALFALIVGVGVWAGTGALSDSVALGLAAFASVVAVRNWSVAEEDRPLLAEELIGIHETLDALREESVEVRAMMSELTVIVEDSLIDASSPRTTPEPGLDIETVAKLATAAEDALDRLEKIERRIAATEGVVGVGGRAAERAADQDGASERLEDIEDRLDKHDRRAVILARAMKLAVAETRDVDSRLQLLIRELAKTADINDQNPVSSDAANVSTEAASSDLLEDAEAVLRSADAETDARALEDEPDANVDDDTPRAASGRSTKPSAARLAEVRAAAEVVKARRETMAAAGGRPTSSGTKRTRRSGDRTRAEAAGAARVVRKTSSNARTLTGDQSGATSGGSAGVDVAKALAAQAHQAQDRARAQARDDSRRPTPSDQIADQNSASTNADSGAAVSDLELEMQPMERLATREIAFFSVAAFPALGRAKSKSAAAGAIAALQETTRAASHLAEAGSTAGVVRPIAFSTLRNPAFMKAVEAAAAEHDALTERLVFELDQRAVRSASDDDKTALAKLRELGFRFALGGVSDWSVAPEHLARLGVGFVKLPADELAPTLGEATSAKNRLDRLRRLGLELIAAGLKDAKQIEELAKAGVGFGEGDAIGEPRLVRLS